MIVKLLGIADIFAAIAFFINNSLNSSNWFPSSILLILASIVFIKGLIFALSGDFASSLDLGCAIILFLSLMIHVHIIFALIAIVLLLQKGIFSMVS